MDSISRLVLGDTKLHKMDLNFIVRQYLAARSRNSKGCYLNLRRVLESYVSLFEGLDIANWAEFTTSTRYSPYGKEVTLHYFLY